MLRNSLAMQGAPPTDEARIELACQAGAAPIKPTPVQDERANRLAIVYRGNVRMGAASVPAVVKIQRVSALSADERALVSAKLDGEHDLILSLQKGTAAAPGGRLPLAPLLSMGAQAETLPSSIICPKARHALTPRCPLDGQELTAEELIAGGAQAHLSCPRCGSQYRLDEATLAAILAASVQRDKGCAGCPHKQDADADVCVSQAAFLNPLPSRVLIFGAWDLDLRDYLRWRQGLKPPPDREGVWARLDEYRRRVRQSAFESADGKAEHQDGVAQSLRDMLAIFKKILDVVEQIHLRQAAVLNLNPHSLVLTIHNTDLEASVADLTMAHHVSAPLSWRQLQLHVPLDSPFAAPECQDPTRTMKARTARRRGEHCELAIEMASVPCGPHGDVPFAVQDWFAVQHEALVRQRYVIQSVSKSDGCWLITGRLYKTEQVGHGGEGDGDLEVAEVDVFHHKHCGVQADLFALGMMLLYLMLPRKSVMTAYRKALTVTPWDTALLPGQVQPAHPRALVQALMAPKLAKPLADFRGCESDLECFGSWRAVAEGLLGIVVRATVRAEGKQAYLASRSSDVPAGLQALRADLERVCADLRGPGQTNVTDDACVPGMLQQSYIESFRKCWSAPGGIPSAIESWKKQYEGLHHWICQFDEIVNRAGENLIQLHAMLSTPLDAVRKAQASNRIRKNTVWLHLPGAPASLAHYGNAAVSALSELDVIFQEVLGKRPEALEQWTRLANRLEREVGLKSSPERNKRFEEHRQRWEQKCREWQTHFDFAVAPLKRYIQNVKATLVVPWTESLQNRNWLKRVIHLQPAGSFLVSWIGVDGLQSIQPVTALELLRQCHLGPVVEVFAAMAVRRYEELRAGQSAAGSRQGGGAPHFKETIMGAASTLAQAGVMLEPGQDDL